MGDAPELRSVQKRLEKVETRLDQLTSETVNDSHQLALDLKALYTEFQIAVKSLEDVAAAVWRGSPDGKSSLVTRMKAVESRMMELREKINSEVTSLEKEIGRLAKKIKEQHAKIQKSEHLDEEKRRWTIGTILTILGLLLSLILGAAGLLLNLIG